MPARTILRGVVLAALVFQVFTFAADAAICKPCPATAGTGCPSSSETTTSAAFPDNRNESSAPSGHASANKQCSLCPFCLAPCIELPIVSVFPDNHVQRFALPERELLYEAPSFALLRPPIA